MLRSLTVSSVVALSAVAAPVASAASPAFFEPRAVSKTGLAFQVFAFMGDGEVGRLAWQDGEQIRVARIPTGREHFSAFNVARLRPSDGFAEVALDARGSATVVFWRGGSGNRRVMASFPGGETAALSSPGASVPALAMNARGDAIAGWALTAGDTVTTQVAIRPAGATAFGPAITLPSSERATDPDEGFAPELAVSPDGHVVIGYEAGRTVWAVTGTIGGGLGAPQRIGTFRPNYGPLSVAASDSRSVIAWTDIAYVGQPAGPTRVSAAIAEADGTFRPARPVASTRDEQPSTLDAPETAITTDGVAIVAWSAMSRLRAATAAPGAALGRPRTLANTAGDYSVDATLAAGGDGKAAIVYNREYPDNVGVRTALHIVRRGADGRWTTPKRISWQGNQSLDPALALGAGDRTVVGWIRSLDGSGSGYVLGSASG